MSLNSCLMTKSLLLRCVVFSWCRRLWGCSVTGLSDLVVEAVASVGIDLKGLRVSCRNVWNFAQGLRFKADFHSKMSVCRHELEGRVQPPPPDNSNPGCSTWSGFDVTRLNSASSAVANRSVTGGVLMTVPQTFRFFEGVDSAAIWSISETGPRRWTV